MINTIKRLLGFGPKVDIGELIANGALIIDVRTPGEYAAGHLKRSTNVPLNDLQKHMTKLKKDATIITCCASGMRSSSAKSILRSNGFNQVFNGGSWQNLKKFE
ncbi:MAG: rhodanese-like domain-containing protein [Mucilaginibacter sp.]